MATIGSADVLSGSKQDVASEQAPSTDCSVPNQIGSQQNNATRACFALVSETYRPEVNGVANTLGYWVDGLKRRGYSVQIIRPRQHSKDLGSQSENERQITCFGLPIPRYSELKFGLPNGAKIKQLWQQQRPLAVYIATEGPLGWSARRAAAALDIPVVSGFHTNFQSYSQFYGLAWLERLILRYLRSFHNQTCATLVPTQTQQQYLEQCDFKAVSVISRGVDNARFSPNKRDPALRATWQRAADMPTEQMVFIYVGRLAHEKNVMQLGHAFKALEREGIKPVVVFVGDGPARAALEQACPKAIFAGVRKGEELARYYASADVFLFPSKTDTFGNVVTEAMASGLAIVAYNDAAAKEHLVHEQSAMLAELNDDAGFIQYIKRLAQEPNTVARLAKAGHAKAQNISWDAVTERFLKALLASCHVNTDHAHHLVSKQINATKAIPDEKGAAP